MILWAEIMATTTYLGNKSSNNHLKDAIYSTSMGNGKKPNMEHWPKTTRNI
jgi:hypothetical protein